LDGYATGTAGEKKEKVVDMIAIVVIKEPILTKLSKSDFCLRL